MTTRRLVKSAVLLILAVALIVVIISLSVGLMPLVLTNRTGLYLLAAVLILVGAAVWKWL